METAYPGFLAFVPQIAHISQIPINLAQLIAAVRGVPNPGIATDLPTLMPNFSGSPSPVAASFRGLGLSYAAGVIGVFAVVLLVRLEVLPPQMGLLFLGLAVFLAIRQPQALEALEKALSQATTAWRNVEARWQQFRDNRSFLDRRRDADDTIRQLQDLPNQERKELAELKQRQHEAQLIAFLEQFYIDHPSTKIKGVGSSRKIMLQSYGIETAADVQQSRIQQISGFGPVITGAIIAWRKSLERRFIFNPNQPIDPAAIAAVKARIAKR